jgi:hypothetical protein
MSRKLKPGDRVRVTSANALPGYRPGDTGTVKDGPWPGVVCDYYAVQMDNKGDDPVVFLAGEIEPVD